MIFILKILLWLTNIFVKKIWVWLESFITLHFVESNLTKIDIRKNVGCCYSIIYGILEERIFFELLPILKKSSAWNKCWKTYLCFVTSLDTSTCWFEGFEKPLEKIVCIFWGHAVSNRCCFYQYFLHSYIVLLAPMTFGFH